ERLGDVVVDSNADEVGSACGNASVFGALAHWQAHADTGSVFNRAADERGRYHVALPTFKAGLHCKINHCWPPGFSMRWLAALHSPLGRCRPILDSHGLPWRQTSP